MKKNKYELIEATKNFLYEKIRIANEELEELRRTCDHPSEHIESVNYEWTNGHIFPNTKVCRICGEVIPVKHIAENVDVTSSAADFTYFTNDDINPGKND
jgi:hypothetical protein